MKPLPPKTFHDLHFHIHLTGVNHARVEMLNLKKIRAMKNPQVPGEQGSSHHKCTHARTDKMGCIAEHPEVILSRTRDNDYIAK